ncbi:MAG: lyase family protein, partial [Patescibacteria group bacterium]
MSRKKSSNQTKLLSLTAISPVDGRYREKTEELSLYLSEYALIKTRVETEIKYLLFLSKVGVAPKITKKSDLQRIHKDFPIKDAQKVKEIEKETNHDVKAVEYFIASRLKSLKLTKLRPFVHFGLTSNDINSLAYRLMIKRALDKVLLPELNYLIKNLASISHKHSSTAMLARTHGQAAVPTTFGKEIAVFVDRLKKQLEHVKNKKMEGKFGGAVG